MNEPPLSVGMCQLEVLDVSHNCLESLPKHLNGLRSLRELHCGHNEISYIPDTIGLIKPLKVMYM